MRHTSVRQTSAHHGAGKQPELDQDSFKELEAPRNSSCSKDPLYHPAGSFASFRFSSKVAGDVVVQSQMASVRIAQLSVGCITLSEQVVTLGSKLVLPPLDSFPVSGTKYANAIKSWLPKHRLMIGSELSEVLIETEEHQGVIFALTPAGKPALHSLAQETLRDRFAGWGYLKQEFDFGGKAKKYEANQLPPIAVTYLGEQASVARQENGFIINNRILPAPFIVLNLSGENVMVDGAGLPSLIRLPNSQHPDLSFDESQRPELLLALLKVAQSYGPVVLLKPSNLPRLSNAISERLLALIETELPNHSYDLRRNLVSIMPLSTELRYESIREEYSVGVRILE